MKPNHSKALPTALSLALIFVASIASNIAIAEERPGERRFYIAPSLLYNSVDEDLGFDDDLGYQFAAGKAFNDYLNLELLITGSDHDGESGGFDGDISLYGLGALIFPMRDRIPFFISAGYFTGEIDRDDARLDHRDAEAWDVGLGYLHEINDGGLAIRAEYRRRNSDYNDVGDGFKDNIFAVGLQIPFGDRPRPATPAAAPPPKPKPKASTPRQPAAPPPKPRCADSDNDAVCEDQDRCPNTPPEQIKTVMENGCGLDDCRLPSPGEAVNEHGCAIEISMVLKDVFFDTNKATLKPESKVRLNKVANVLKATPTVKLVEISGHTDNRGSDAYNKKLSQQRAESAVAYLASQGVEKNRMKAQGYGETQPIASNIDAAGRSQNRRVELKVLKRGN